MGKSVDNRIRNMLSELTPTSECKNAVEQVTPPAPTIGKEHNSHALLLSEDPNAPGGAFSAPRAKFVRTDDVDMLACVHQDPQYWGVCW